MLNIDFVDHVISSVSDTGPHEANTLQDVGWSSGARADVWSARAGGSFVVVQSLSRSDVGSNSGPSTIVAR